MSDRRDTDRFATSARTRAVRPVAGAALLLVGLAALGLWRILSGSEDVPFEKGATPPSTVSVTSGHTYSLAVPGGVHAMHDHGVPLQRDSDTLALECRYTTPGQPGTAALPVTPEGLGSKYETRVGSFVAPISGRIHVECSGWGAMFVPDSDDRATDFAGYALLASIIMLTIGAALVMTEIRVLILRTARLRASRDEEDVEGCVDVPTGREDDREVGSSDRGDVGGELG